jgi:hypothetical protein
MTFVGTNSGQWETYPLIRPTTARFWRLAICDNHGEYYTGVNHIELLPKAGQAVTLNPHGPVEFREGSTDCSRDLKDYALSHLRAGLWLVAHRDTHSPDVAIEVLLEKLLRRTLEGFYPFEDVTAAALRLLGMRSPDDTLDLSHITFPLDRDSVGSWHAEVVVDVVSGQWHNLPRLPRLNPTYPGRLPSDAPRVRRELTLEASAGRGWLSTGLYLDAGDTLTVTVQASSSPGNHHLKGGSLVAVVGSCTNEPAFAGAGAGPSAGVMGGAGGEPPRRPRGSQRKRRAPAVALAHHQPHPATGPQRSHPGTAHDRKRHRLARSERFDDVLI